MLANNSFVDAPLGGYQYAIVDTASEFDPYSIYLSGATNCANFDASATQYYQSAEFNVTEGLTRTMYQSLGHALLSGVLPQEQWSFSNGYMIYDYISYMNTHNSTAKDILNGPAYRDNIDQLGALASQKQWDIYANLTPSGMFLGDHIRTIGGQTLAARILGMLIDNIETGGAENVCDSYACMARTIEKLTEDRNSTYLSANTMSCWAYFLSWICHMLTTTSCISHLSLLLWLSSSLATTTIPQTIPTPIQKVYGCDSSTSTEA